MLFYIICYDIPDNQRRKQISDLLEGYGSRIQYSVFECILEQKQFQDLQKKLKKMQFTRR
jgi:CRISPR-associated protein Cas2